MILGKKLNCAHLFKKERKLFSGEISIRFALFCEIPHFGTDFDK